MKYKVALFDVDGTIINGNCTQIFIQYLFEEKIIDKRYFSQYFQSINQQLTFEGNNLKIAEEAFSIISRLNSENFQNYWNKCFTRRIKNRFYDNIVRKIKFFQSRGVEIILASGSPEILIREVASALKIPKENIIATQIQIPKDPGSSNSSTKHCIGEGKESAVLDLFNIRSINLNDVCFFTNNLSDLNLLSNVGQGYWVGSKYIFKSRLLSTNGILLFIPEITAPSLDDESKVLLDKYYLEKKSIIEESILSIFPVECNQQTIDGLIGKNYLDWDLPTMQRTYFDPINEYLEKYSDRLITLGTCLLMEGGGIKLNDIIPLLSMGELLNISNEVFIDITNWTSGNNKYKYEKSHAEISILGNASISLLSLPLHNIIQDKPKLDPDIKLKIYEIYTSIVYNSLFGNGIRLYWERQNENHISFKEYFKIATLMNAGFLQFSTNLLLILSKQNNNVKLKNTFLYLSNYTAILIQLTRDQIAFSNWQKNLHFDRKKKFDLLTNFICVHACQFHNNPKLLNVNQTKKEVNELFISADSFNYLENKIKYYQNKVANSINSLPFTHKYKMLIHSYVNQFIHL